MTGRPAREDEILRVERLLDGVGADVVVKEWLAGLPWKRQSAFFSALRGPDHAHCQAVKQVVKFLRHVSQENADPASNYMRRHPSFGPPMTPARREWFKQLERELEFCSLHFVAHLIEAVQVVEFAHPDEEFVAEARQLLDWFEETFHLQYVGPARG